MIFVYSICCIFLFFIYLHIRVDSLNIAKQIINDIDPKFNDYKFSWLVKAIDSLPSEDKNSAFNRLLKNNKLFKVYAVEKFISTQEELTFFAKVISFVSCCSLIEYSYNEKKINVDVVPRKNLTINVFIGSILVLLFLPAYILGFAFSLITSYSTIGSMKKRYDPKYKSPLLFKNKKEDNLNSIYEKD